MGNTIFSGAPPADEFYKSMLSIGKEFQQSESFRRLSSGAKSLWRKNGNYFYLYFVHELRSKRQLRKKLEMLEGARKRFVISDEDDKIERDLKLRQQKLAGSLSEGVQKEIEEEIIADGQALFPFLARKLELYSNPREILKKYFTDFKFIRKRLWARLLMEGKSDKEIKSVLDEHEEMYMKVDNDGRRAFAFPMRLLIISTRRSPSIASQIGRAFSFLPSVNLEYGTKHLAIQLGYYIIHWLDDSFVHIDLLSSKNVMAMIYPRYPSTQGCVKQLSQNIEKSYLKDVAELIVKYNTSIAYDKMNFNCQRFANELLIKASMEPNWHRNGPIRKYVEAVATEVVDPKVPLHFWTIQGTVLVEHKFHSVEQFKQWCRDNKIREKRFQKGSMTAENENFELCKALWRASQVKHMSGNEDSSASSRASFSRPNNGNPNNVIDEDFESEDLNVLTISGITVGRGNKRQSAPQL